MLSKAHIVLAHGQNLAMLELGRKFLAMIMLGNIDFMLTASDTGG